MTPHLIVETTPVSATAVYLRESGSGPFHQVGDHTPVSLELTPAHYDVRVEAADGPFIWYRGECREVQPGYDHPTIEMHREVSWFRLTTVALALLLVALRQGWRRKHRKPGAPTPVVPETPEVAFPDLIGRALETGDGRHYRIESELGRGQMGVVLAASAVPRDQAGYAVKVLHRMGAEKAWLRFDREVRLCTRLSHPNIVAVLGSGLYRWGHNAWPFMVMERVEGLTLKKRFESYRTVDEVVGWMRQVLRGLSVAHAAGVVHRDLTPDNILITRDDVVKIMDFGVAFQVGEHDLTQTGQALGTPVYMSPEHLDAKGATPASDVYSVGVVFYQALSGAIPHDAPEVWGLLARKLSEPPADLGARCPELDPRLVSVVMRMLAADPANRYQTADQVLDALDRHTE